MNIPFWIVFATAFTSMGYWAAHLYFARKDRKSKVEDFIEWHEKAAKDVLEGK